MKIKLSNKNKFVKYFFSAFFICASVFFTYNSYSAGGTPGAPSKPTITTGYSMTALPTNAFSFGVVSTDAEGDRINYLVDVNNDGTADANYGQYNVPVGWPSGTTIMPSHSYPTVGTYIIKVKAVQSNNSSLQSAWSDPLTVTVALSGSTGCWAEYELEGAQSSCAEGPGPGQGDAYVVSPQGINYSYANGNIATTPVCGAGAGVGDTINLGTYPNRYCYVTQNYGYNSYQNGCIADSYSEVIRIDGGTCSAPPSYNCESGQLNPSLAIVSNNSLIGVALNTGMRWFHNVFYGACYHNTSGVNYFVPTKTQTEFNSFRDHLPPGVSKANGGW